MYSSDIRILRIIDVLVFYKKVKDPSEFCDKIEMHRQTLTKIKKDMAHFTPEHIERMCKIYGINSNCIFGIEKKVFFGDKSVEINVNAEELIANKK